jgi:hypothetical protein
MARASDIIDSSASEPIATVSNHRRTTLPRHDRLLRDQLRLTVNDLNPRLPSELDARGPDLTASHFTSPWTVQELEACFVVIDSSGQKLAFVYHQDEPSRRAAAKLPSKDQARQIAANIAKLPELLREE